MKRSDWYNIHNLGIQIKHLEFENQFKTTVILKLTLKHILIVYVPHWIFYESTDTQRDTMSCIIRENVESKAEEQMTKHDIGAPHYVTTTNTALPTNPFNVCGSN